MPRSPSLLLLTCAFALLVTGCDRQTAPPAQPQESPAPEKAAEQLTGKLDRSFAGMAMPVATLSDPNGAKLDTSDLKGQPVLLNLWATWCAPCVVEMPLLNRLAGELDGKVRLLTVSEDLNGAAAVEPFFAARKLDNLPQWVDQETKLAAAFGGGAALPLTVLYDAQGKEVWRVMGGYDWASEQAQQQVSEVLKET
jgi:thiol-disulfide isomerase/thioredoxin